MKRILILLLITAMALAFTACGKKCSECGKTVNKGYTVFGNFVCEDCFW